LQKCDRGSFMGFVGVRLGVATWVSRICIQPSSFHRFWDLDVHTAGKTDIGRKRFLLHITYFSKNLVYPFTLRVTGIIMIFSISPYV